MSTPREGETQVEKIIRNIAGAIILLMLGWFGTMALGWNERLGEIAQTLASISTEVANLREDMNVIQKQMLGNYSKEDAERDFRIRDRAVDTIEERLRRLEQRVFEEPSRQRGQ